MEIFLYGCEVCNNIVFTEEDYGNVHVHMCRSCSGGTFHKKIVIGAKYSHDISSIFNVFMLEEKKDGSDKKG